MGMTKDKMEFAYLMAKHSTATLRDIEALLRYGATYNRIATDMLNGPDYSKCRNDAERNHVSKVWQEYQDTLPVKQSRIKMKIHKILGTFNASARFQNDARGCTVKIAVPDGYTNDWGKEGICVPTA